MPLPPAVRSFLPLVVGLAVGGLGVFLFQESLPGPEGSAEERAKKLELELQRAQNRIAALEAASAATPDGQDPVFQRVMGGYNQRKVSDSARRILEDIRAGRPVTPEDIFRASQPLIRDLAPLFDRMRLKEQRQAIDSLTGELARKYHLTPEKQQLLKAWFEKSAEQEAKRWTEMIASEHTRLEDIVRATRDLRIDQGLDAYMPAILTGDQLTAFKSERLAERVKNVESEADAMVHRLDSIVTLDEAQRDQVFGIAARTSHDYDPRMVFESGGREIGPTPGGNRQEALLGILRPDQRAAYETERERRRQDASKEMESMGLALPAEWDMFDDFYR